MAYQPEVEKLEKQYQTNPDQYFAPLADAYRKAGNLDFALDIVRNGLAKRPNYLSAHIVLGIHSFSSPQTLTSEAQGIKQSFCLAREEQPRRPHPPLLSPLP